MASIYLGGENREIHTGINQGDIFCRLQGLSLAQYAATFSDIATLGLGAQRDFLYSALRAGAERLGQPFELTPQEVGDMMDAPDYIAKECLGKVIGELGKQFAAKAAYQKEREAKNVPTPPATSDATGLTVS